MLNITPLYAHSCHGHLFPFKLHTSVHNPQRLQLPATVMSIAIAAKLKKIAKEAVARLITTHETSTTYLFSLLPRVFAIREFGMYSRPQLLVCKFNNSERQMKLPITAHNCSPYCKSDWPRPSGHAINQSKT